MSAASSAVTPRREEMIVVWVDSDTSPRAQLEDPSIDVASLPNMDDPWKIRLDDFEEPVVDYINEDWAYELINIWNMNVEWMGWIMN